jgi:hypothetical protein
MGLKNKSRHAALVCGALALALASAGALADSAGKWTSGKEVYDKVCGYCHEPNPGLGPNIRGAHPRDVQERVRKGHRAMPAFRQSEIDDRALAQLVEFLK